MAEVKSSSSLQYSAMGDGSKMNFDDNNGSTHQSQASRISEAAKERVTREVDSRKGMIASQLNDIASALEETARTLESNGIKGVHKIATMASERVRSFSQSIEGRSVDELVGMAKQQFRASPLPIIAACAAVGFFGARLLRS
jgi:hypothetical protein